VLCNLARVKPQPRVLVLSMHPEEPICPARPQSWRVRVHGQEKRTRRGSSKPSERYLRVAVTLVQRSPKTRYARKHPMNTKTRSSGRK
jgi:hypothetical protein